MIYEWIKNNLLSNSIVVEAGTCNGVDTRWFSQYFNDGMIYGFEPILELYTQAVENVNFANNVKIINKALSDKTGHSKIYVSDLSGMPFGSSSLLIPKEHLKIHTGISFNTELEIETINLDDWFQSEKFNHIDFMWLDMQGSEPIVLKNAPIALSKTRYLYTEVSLIETYKDVILYPEFKKFLLENRFEMVFEDLPWQDMGNVLFKNTA